MSDLTKLMLGIVSALVVAAIIAAWKLISGKADKSFVEKAAKTNADSIQAVNVRVDNFANIIAQAVMKTDLIRDLATASIRADDKDLRVQKDIAELKADAKTTVEKLTQVDKKLDDLPTRVAGLEQSNRNKHETQ